MLGVGSPLALKMNFLTTRTGKGGSPQVLIKATAFYLSHAKALAANASVQANLDTVAKARAALSLNVFRPVVTGFNNTEVSLPPARVSLSERYVGDSYLWVWSDGLMAVLWSVLGAAILSCVATCGAHAPCACTVRMHRPSPPWAPPLAAMGNVPPPLASWRVRRPNCPTRFCGSGGTAYCIRCPPVSLCHRPAICVTHCRCVRAPLPRPAHSGRSESRQATPTEAQCGVRRLRHLWLLLRVHAPILRLPRRHRLGGGHLHYVLRQ